MTTPTEPPTTHTEPAPARAAGGGGLAELTGPWSGFAIGIIAGALVLALFGFVNSFEAVLEAVRPSFGDLAWTVPVMVDVGIVVFSGLDLLFTKMRMRIWWLKFIPLSLIAVTIYLNVAHQVDAVGWVAHTVAPALWFIPAELGALFLRRKDGLEAHKAARRAAGRLDRLGFRRWLLAPVESAQIRRRMILDQITDLDVARERVYARQDAAALLKDRYGRGWRRKTSHSIRRRYRRASLNPELLAGILAELDQPTSSGPETAAHNPGEGVLSLSEPVPTVVDVHGATVGTPATGETGEGVLPLSVTMPAAAGPITASPAGTPATRPATRAGRQSGTGAGTPNQAGPGTTAQDPAHPNGTTRPAIPARANGTDAGTRQEAARRTPETVGTRAAPLRSAQNGPSTEPVAGTAPSGRKLEAATPEGKRQATLEDARAVAADLAAEGAALSARKLAEGLRARGLTCGQKLRDELLAQLRSDEPATSDSNRSEGAVKASEAPTAGREAPAVSGIGREENPGSGADVAGDTGDTTRAAARDLSGVGQ